MLKEREEALVEADEPYRLAMANVGSVQYDHTNHIVTMTTVKDIDL